MESSFERLPRGKKAGFRIKGSSFAKAKPALFRNDEINQHKLIWSYQTFGVKDGYSFLRFETKAKN